ncbi:MAG: SUMF1/EgtB/PvdO family nonheme iron enzyme [Phycisphaeraceae bacterium]|nr:SUMF1/EgtB/PvdO family nonheme iron enzyme [Phycisphaeraceae bacterium]
MKIRSCGSVVSVLACASVVVAQGSGGGGAANNQHLRFTQEHGFTFSTIGDAGNAPAQVPNWRPSPQNPGPTRPLGGVDYEYRIATTEVTWGQYFDFVQAYAPVMPTEFRLGIGTRDRLVPEGSMSLNSPIQFAGLSGGVAQFTLDQSRADKPATSNWLYFARMVNWLHNGARPASEVTSADFETGAYDTSTFARIPTGPKGVSYRTDQDSRSPDAKFWIPSADELAKATFYDPNRHGEGQGGYWLYGHSSDDAPIPGDPALGGETNAGRDGIEWPAGQFRPLDSGSYPHVQSPWGLLDTTGGGAEWTETWREDQEFMNQSRIVLGAAAYRDPAHWDMEEAYWLGPTTGDGTLRLAAAIPSPGAGVALGLALMMHTTARRRR